MTKRPPRAGLAALMRDIIRQPVPPGRLVLSAGPEAAAAAAAEAPATAHAGDSGTRPEHGARPQPTWITRPAGSLAPTGEAPPAEPHSPVEWAATPQTGLVVPAAVTPPPAVPTIVVRPAAAAAPAPPAPAANPPHGSRASRPASPAQPRVRCVVSLSSVQSAHLQRFADVHGVRRSAVLRTALGVLATDPEVARRVADALLWSG